MGRLQCSPLTSLRFAGHIVRRSHAQIPAAECVDADRHCGDGMGAYTGSRSAMSVTELA